MISLSSTSTNNSAANSPLEQQRTLKALKELRAFKLVCGAAYSDFNGVSRFSEVFARAGAHIIDVAAHPTIVSAAQEGILRSAVPPERRPLIMASLSLGLENDPHFRRVALDSNLCDTCGACIPACPTQAFSIQSGQLQYLKERCYGCGACVPLCHVSALTPQPVPALQPNILPELWELGARSLEIHVGPNFSWLDSYLQIIRDISPHPWLISICIGSGLVSYDELQEQTKHIHKLIGDGAIIQVDGRTTQDDTFRRDASSLQALACAQAVLDTGLPVSVMVAGGMTDNIRTLLNQFDLKVNGVSMRSFVKRTIEPFINDLETAEGIARKLVNSVKPC